MIEKRPFGNTGLQTTLLGFGAGQIGDAKMPDAQVESLLNEVLNLGINLIDTARGYGLSEERIGRFLAHRRDEFILSTKVGYSVDGLPDWTYDTIIAGVEQARRRLQSDVLDIVHLHSCPADVMQNNGLLDALQETVSRGWVKIPAYSGENEALDFAVASGKIGRLQATVNLNDQRNIDGAIAQAQAADIGTIAKRTIGNAPWRFSERPVGEYCEPYWERSQAMGLAVDLPWIEAALRFTVFSTGIDCAIIGTTNIHHLRENVTLLQKGALPAELVSEIRAAFAQHDAGWVGQI